MKPKLEERRKRWRLAKRRSREKQARERWRQSVINNPQFLAHLRAITEIEYVRLAMLQAHYDWLEKTRYIAAEREEVIRQFKAEVEGVACTPMWRTR
jgi:malate synthase